MVFTPWEVSKYYLTMTRFGFQLISRVAKFALRAPLDCWGEQRQRRRRLRSLTAKVTFI